MQLIFSVYRFGSFFTAVDKCVAEESPKLLPDKVNEVREA